MSAALPIEHGEKALICFPDDGSYKKCEIFDSKASILTAGTAFSHRGGKLGFYKGKPTTVGTTLGLSDELNKVETLSTSGWLNLADHPLQFEQK